MNTITKLEKACDKALDDETVIGGLTESEIKQQVFDPLFNAWAGDSLHKAYEGRGV